MRVLSLFDGISCGRLALDRAGVPVDEYLSSEIDKYAIQVSEIHYPGMKRLGDVRKINGEDLGSIDLMIGGSPCQSFSRSGDNSGFDGKSGLFFEYLRILNEVKPKYFLLENVVMKKEWENKISELLGVEPVMIDSSLFSAQKRQRLYWTNIPFDKDIKDRGVLFKDIFLGGERKEIETPLILDRNDIYIYIRNATKLGYLKAKDGDCVNLEVPGSKTRRGRVSVGKTNTLNTACNYGYVTGNKLVEIDIIEYERLQTLPDNYTDCIPLTQRKKVIGNGWTVDVIAHILKGLNRNEYGNE